MERRIQETTGEILKKRQGSRQGQLALATALHLDGGKTREMAGFSRNGPKIRTEVPSLCLVFSKPHQKLVKVYILDLEVKFICSCHLWRRSRGVNADYRLGEITGVLIP